MIVHQMAHKPFGKYRGKLFSPLASVRLRALEISPFLAKLGNRVRIVPFEDAAEAKRDGRLLEADVYVIHKALYDMSALLEELRGAGKHVVVDVCDDVLALPHLRSFYPDMLRYADVVTTSSEGLATILRPAIDVPVHFVSDCVELARGAPATGTSSAEVRLLWFGNSANLQPMADQLPGLADLARRTPCALEVMCDVTPEVSTVFGKHWEPLAITLTPWSPDGLEAALARCDFVLLPSSNAPGMSSKSANRLQETLWSGRLPIAHPVGSYAPFAEAAILAGDLSTAIDWARAHPREVMDRIIHGQSLIEERCTPAVVAASWNRVIHEAVARPPRRSGSPGTRLNLGCGDKLLAGYVNVDIAEGRGGVRPDILCDLRSLDFQSDASADEVLAVHVVEHFWRWEVVDILKEWVRVLKPGGRMVLECPNLKSACEALLREPVEGANADERGQETMWVLYGDPAWRDPLMCHRWGYTPTSLGQVMAEAGLIDIRQEPAQFKLRDPRDMRMVGQRAP